MKKRKAREPRQKKSHADADDAGTATVSTHLVIPGHKTLAGIDHWALGDSQWGCQKNREKKVKT